MASRMTSQGLCDLDGNLYILHLGEALGKARIELSSLVRGIWARSEDMMRDDCHCWDLAAVEEEVVEMTQGSPAMAGKGMSVQEESQETLGPVEEESVGLISVSEAR